MKRTSALIPGFITIIALLLVACGSSGSSGSSGASNSVTQLTFWYSEGQGESPAILNLVNAFNSSHPAIQVTAQYEDANSIGSQFASVAKAGTGAPDVVRTDSTRTAEFAKDGYLLKLTGKIAGGTSDFLPAPLAYDMYHGDLWGLPETTDFLVLYYNKALVPTPPATMDDLRTAAMQATNASAGQYGFATQGSSYYVTPFIFADGGGLVSDDGKTILVNNAQSVAGFQRLLDMITSGSVQPVDFQNGFTNALEGFKVGKVAMLMEDSSEATNLMSGSAFQGATASNFGIAAIPTGTAGDVPRALAGGENYAIYAGSHHPNAALTFLNYLDSATNQSAVAKANGTLPTRTSAYTADVLANPLIAPFQPLEGTAKARPVNPNAGQIFTAFDTDIQNALQLKDTSQNALNKVAQDWAPLFSGS